MALDPDPFARLPWLRGHIADPARSRFRLDGEGVEFWDRVAEEAGYPDGWRFSDDRRNEIRARALAGRLGEDLWVFAYGSLMWDPAFYFEELRCATVRGLRRSFCLRIELGRGAPGSPALMVALDTGGECHGLAFRIARERIETESDMLFRREMITSGYRADFVDVATPEGTVEALAFVADTGSDKYVGELDADEAAAIVATGSGVLGTNLEYLEELAGRLEDLNVPDPDFFALYERARKRAAR